MSRFNKPQEIGWRNILAQMLIAIVAITIIVWFLPRGSKSSMHFDVGRPWPYGQLIAPFDFPVFKTDAQLQAERDSIRRVYEPYFELDPQVERVQMAAMRAEIRDISIGDLSFPQRAFIE